MEGRELPRPPRRIPTGTEAYTQLETSTPGDPQPPPRPPWIFGRILAGFIVLLFFIPTLQENDAMVWLWTCLAGFLLGLLGLSVYALQRRAARLGRRSANQMALDESI